jgi:Cof subfamily protein (haloacid dehalogenase superfamily)
MKLTMSFIVFLKKLKEKNILFAIASGRQYFNLLEKFDSIKDDIIFMAENGSYVMYKNKQILLSCLDNDIAMKLIDTSRTLKHAYRIVCGAKYAYVEQNDLEFIQQVEKYYKKYLIVDDLKKINDNILKITICDLTGTQDNNASAFSHYKDNLLIAISGKIWLDISTKIANKGFAVKKTQEMFNISYEETMVFGDYLNDLQLMNSAFYSFAMENAHNDIKKNCKIYFKKQ